MTLGQRIFGGEGVAVTQEDEDQAFAFYTLEWRGESLAEAFARYRQRTEDRVRREVVEEAARVAERTIPAVCFESDTTQTPTTYGWRVVSAIRALAWCGTGTNGVTGEP